MHSTPCRTERGCYPQNEPERIRNFLHEKRVTAQPCQDERGGPEKSRHVRRGGFWLGALAPESGGQQANETDEPDGAKFTRNLGEIVMSVLSRVESKEFRRRILTRPQKVLTDA